ncbi:MAG: thiamine phosphate synthase [Brevundimonas sp.]|uniref:thiamine phosphate synthase n=1 Tax=Brevundimonas sp. TaxID=1871086 RepID=UPI0025B93EFA|nr:thiamine phosphate synthase [Brevundimonas sp.]MBX3476856.1 thiamine phosphate synthase [Brevundimonas sp.]
MTADHPDDAARLWRQAQALNRRAAAVSPAAGDLPPLLFFTDGPRTPRPWETASRLPAGAAVVFRAFGAEDAIKTGRRLRTATAGRGVRLLVGADADLAQALDADGVHLPERMAGRAADLRRARPDWLITAAIHAISGPLPLDSLDALVASPVFATASASARPVLGLEGLARATALGRPTYALGGIDAETAARLADSGVCGLAAVGAVQSAFARPIRI